MATKLTGKQEAFCREYLHDFNATQAAIRSGYSEKTARVVASENLTKPSIQTRIAELVKELHNGDPTDMIRKCILELQTIAFGDYEDLVTWNDGRIAWKDSKTLGEKTKLVKEISEGANGARSLKVHDKKWAFEMLGKYYGFLKDKVDITSSDGSMQPIVNIVIPSNGREAGDE